MTSSPAAKSDRVIATKLHAPLWLLLSACGTALLAAFTNVLVQRIAPIPLLWVLPLALYLLSLVLSFSDRNFYSRRSYIVFSAAMLMAFSVLTLPGFEAPLVLAGSITVALLFSLCMLCHGELYNLRPQSGDSSVFYVYVSAGGWIGTALIAIAAPALFSTFIELPLALLVTFAAVGTLTRAQQSHLSPSICAAASALCLLLITIEHTRPAKRQARNFYGAVEVRDLDFGEGQTIRALMHGGIIHGLQLTSEQSRRKPLAYFSPSSGAGSLLSNDSASRRVGVIGLGVGTLAAYGKAGDYFRFYEINPEVVNLAREEFWFLQDCPSNFDLVLGDGRRALEEEGSNNFDVLVVDAFNGDSVPVQLITREAFAIYRRHLRDNGHLVLHITNRYLDLWPNVQGLACAEGFAARLVGDEGDITRGVLPSRYAVLQVSGLPGGDCPGFWTDRKNYLLSAFSSRPRSDPVR